MARNGGTFTNKDIIIMVQAVKDANTHEHAELTEKLNKVHLLAAATNGKVRMHTKLIWGCYGFSFAVLGFLIKHMVG